MRNLPLTFDCSTYSQKLEEDFAKFCGLVRIYELYLQKNNIGHTKVHRIPESASIEMPPFRPQYIKFPKTVFYSVNLVSPCTEVLLLGKLWSKTATKILLLCQAFVRYFWPFFQTVVYLDLTDDYTVFFPFHYFFLFIVCPLLKTKLSSTVAY